MTLIFLFYKTKSLLNLTTDKITNKTTYLLKNNVIDINNTSDLKVAKKLFKR